MNKTLRSSLFLSSLSLLPRLLEIQNRPDYTEKKIQGVPRDWGLFGVPESFVFGNNYETTKIILDCALY